MGLQLGGTDWVGLMVGSSVGLIKVGVARVIHLLGVLLLALQLKAQSPEIHWLLLAVLLMA